MEAVGEEGIVFAAFVGNAQVAFGPRFLIRNDAAIINNVESKRQVIARVVRPLVQRFAVPGEGLVRSNRLSADHLGLRSAVFFSMLSGAKPPPYRTLLVVHTRVVRTLIGAVSYTLPLARYCSVALTSRKATSNIETACGAFNSIGLYRQPISGCERMMFRTF